MRKIITAALLATLALSASACNQRGPGEVETCSYNLERNEKTCNLKQSERKEMLENIQAARDDVKVVDGVSYRQQADGSLIPIR